MEDDAKPLPVRIALNDSNERVIYPDQFRNYWLGTTPANPPAVLRSKDGVDQYILCLPGGFVFNEIDRTKLKKFYLLEAIREVYPNADFYKEKKVARSVKR